MGKRHGGAVESHIGAVVGIAACAFGAIAAGTRGRDGDQITHGQSVDTRAQSGHIPRHFMSQNHRFAQAYGAKSAMQVVVQVRAADATACHFDANFARLWGEGFAVAKLQIARSVGVKRRHRGVLQDSPHRCYLQRGKNGIPKL